MVSLLISYGADINCLDMVNNNNNSIRYFLFIIIIIKNFLRQEEVLDNWLFNSKILELLKYFLLKKIMEH